MIRVNVQDDADAGEHVQEAVRVLAGLRGKIVTASDPYISADAVQNAADGKGGICTGFHHDLRDHGSRCRLTVSAAYRDGIFVGTHDLAEQNGSADVRNSAFHDRDVFRIVRVDRRCKDDQIDVGSDILFLLSDDDLYPVLTESISNGGRSTVRAGYAEAFAPKDLREAAHGDPADSREIDVDRIIEIELIHKPS